MVSILFLWRETCVWLVLVSMASNQNRDAFPVSWTVFRWVLPTYLEICCISFQLLYWASQHNLAAKTNTFIISFFIGYESRHGLIGFSPSWNQDVGSGCDLIWGLGSFSKLTGLGSVQLLVVVWLRPCAPRRCPATWHPPQHSFLLFQGQFEDFLHASNLYNLWSF